MTNEEAIKNLENDIRRYSKKEFDENTSSLGLKAVLKHRKEKLESYKIAINSIQENTKLKAENEELKAELEQSIKLPCKAGDIVYTVYNVKGREPVISENKFTLKYYADNINYFGKAIFLTREEAEDKLKEMNE